MMLIVAQIAWLAQFLSHLARISCTAGRIGISPGQRRGRESAAGAGRPDPVATGINHG
jgi:hypothetical protein